MQLERPYGKETNVKKHMIILLAVASVFALALSLAGCGKGGDEPATTDTPAANSTGTASMANPWSDALTLDEAIDGAGLPSFVVPLDVETPLGVSKAEWSEFRYMNGLVEVHAPVAAVEMWIRKGDASLATDGNISGVYDEFVYKWDTTVAGKTVHCAGDREGDSKLSYWTDGGYCYSIYVIGGGGDIDFGLNQERLAFFVNNIK